MTIKMRCEKCEEEYHVTAEVNEDAVDIMREENDWSIWIKYIEDNEPTYGCWCNLCTDQLKQDTGQTPEFAYLLSDYASHLAKHQWAIDRAAELKARLKTIANEEKITVKEGPVIVKKKAGYDTVKWDSKLLKALGRHDSRIRSARKDGFVAQTVEISYKGPVE